MAYCIERSQLDPSRHRIVSGPWKGGCASCSENSCECIKPPCECCCLKVPLETPDGEKSIGIPKSVKISVTSNAICHATSLDPMFIFDYSNGFPNQKINPCYTNDTGGIYGSGPSPKECLPSYQKIFEENECVSSVIDISPSFNIYANADDQDTTQELQVWSSSEDCDAMGNPKNPKFLTQEARLKISSCGNESVHALTLAFSAEGIDLNFDPISFKTCESQEFTARSQDVPVFPWRARYRREYDDYTLDEKTLLNMSFAYDVLSLNVQILCYANPTCREPETTQFCNCLDLELYNVIDVKTLTSYEVSPEPGGCNGKPIDINVVCGSSGPDLTGDQDVDGGVTMYYSPYPNTVPVIDNIAYDTTNLPPAPAGKVNVLEIRSALTRNEIRFWVCDHLKFATITNATKWPSDPDAALTFNWPFNDLYFEPGCSGGETVNLVPC